MILALFVYPCDRSKIVLNPFSSDVDDSRSGVFEERDRPGAGGSTEISGFTSDSSAGEAAGGAIAPSIEACFDVVEDDVDLAGGSGKSLCSPIEPANPDSPSSIDSSDLPYFSIGTISLKANQAGITDARLSAMPTYIWCSYLNVGLRSVAHATAAPRD